MTKLVEKDQEIFNRLKSCMADCIDRANLSRLANNHFMANWYMKEYERCSRDMDKLPAKYDEKKIITEYINGTVVTGKRDYVERMRKTLTEGTVNVNVTVVVRQGR